MKIAIAKERAHYERRVAATPETVKKFIDMGIHCIVEADAGEESSFPDYAYQQVGAWVVDHPKTLYEEADIILKVKAPIKDKKLDEFSFLPEKAVVIGLLDPFHNKDQIKHYNEKKITSFSLEFMPRITRAQSMDVLSSQSNLAGYRAVIEAAFEFGRAFPLMMTAAGTIPAARVLVLGAGVAGLQAIATARRLGAVVSAFDVRKAAREQVESLGATFIEVESSEIGDQSSGYAKEMGEEYRKAQEARIREEIRKHDIIICTALIPGKTAPILIKEDMMLDMKKGTVIVDLAVEMGGNCELSSLGEIVEKNGVRIIGHHNIQSRIPCDASMLYSRNIFNFLKLMIVDHKPHVEIPLDNEIITATMLTHNGQTVHPLLSKEA